MYMSLVAINQDFEIKKIFYHPNANENSSSSS